jgi:hypothetical protein
VLQNLLTGSPEHGKAGRGRGLQRYQPLSLRPVLYRFAFPPKNDREDKRRVVVSYNLGRRSCVVPALGTPLSWALKSCCGEDTNHWTCRSPDRAVSHPQARRGPDQPDVERRQGTPSSLFVWDGPWHKAASRLFRVWIRRPICAAQDG